MAAFLLDENLSVRLAELLPELRLAGVVDSTLLLEAAARGLVLVTENHKDFLNLHQAWRLWTRAWNVSLLQVHPGILTVPQLPTVRLEETAEAIAQLAGSGRQLRNELHHWRAGQGWELQPE